MENTKVLAKVENQEITQGDLNFFMRRLDPQTSAQFQSENGQKQLLDELINQELLYLEAIEQGLNENQEYLKEVERLKATLLKQFAVNHLLGKVALAEDEVSSYYIENKAQFVQPRSVQASHILVETQDVAQDIIKELEDGLSFSEAAEKYSSCPSKAKGGDLGFFSKGQMVPEFEEAAFSLERGTISQPVQSEFGFHIIKVTDEKKEGTLSLEEVKPQLEKQLLGEKQQRVYFDRITSLRGKYHVEISE